MVFCNVIGRVGEMMRFAQLHVMGTHLDSEFYMDILVVTKIKVLLKFCNMKY